jgi:hypothetical protein
MVRRKMNRDRRHILMALGGTAWAALAFMPAAAVAHHSAAMFDQQKQVELSGTVRQFQWTNPHCYIQLLVKNAQGKEEEWSLEMGAPVYLYNVGWRPGTVKAGDRISVAIAPLRKGGRGGLLLKATGADGKPLGKRPLQPAGKPADKAP